MQITKYKELAKPTNERILSTLLISIALIILAVYLVIKNDTKAFIDPKGNKIAVVVVDNEAERIQGLSGRDSLARDEGMLFIFENEDTKRCFWMKDMKFSIDIIWIDSSKRVVDVKQGAMPASYPENYCARGASRYVLEVPSGQAAERGFVIGAQVKF
ncbi:MAG: DUF192 domain-containing protein [bacterium]|nr:DUF192 domain-containing protein [bacterium]